LNIGAHFEQLREEIHEMKMKEFIGHHRDVLALADELKEIFTPIIFVEFLAFSFVFCGVGVSLAITRDFFEHLLLAFYGSAMLVQLFIYCYCGQYIKDRAASLCDEVYGFDQNYVIIIMRAHKGVRLEAPFFRASLEQFSSVLNTTWMLISIIRSSMK
jgi:hypothetical protein